MMFSRRSRRPDNPFAMNLKGVTWQFLHPSGPFNALSDLRVYVQGVYDTVDGQHIRIERSLDSEQPHLRIQVRNSLRPGVYTLKFEPRAARLDLPVIPPCAFRVVQLEKRSQLALQWARNVYNQDAYPDVCTECLLVLGFEEEARKLIGRATNHCAAARTPTSECHRLKDLEQMHLAPTP
jgi:hypothetical protein